MLPFFLGLGAGLYGINSLATRARGSLLDEAIGSEGWEQSGPFRPEDQTMGMMGNIKNPQVGARGLLADPYNPIEQTKARATLLSSPLFSSRTVDSIINPLASQQQQMQELLLEQNKPLTVKDQFQMEQDLAKQRTTMLKPYMEQRQAAQKTMTALEQRTGAGDLAAVISFNKSLDPSSVVRESEQKAVTGVAGPIERFRALLQDVQGEGTLTDDTRAMLASLIEEIQINEAQNANNIIADYESRAKGYSLDPMAIRGGQLGYDPQGQPISRFSSIRAPETILNAQERARAELRRRGAL